MQLLGWEDEVQYLMSSHNQPCNRDLGNNVVCDYSATAMSATGAGMGSGGKVVPGWQGGGKDGRARISCKSGFSHFVDTCIEASLITNLPTAASYDDTKVTCDQLGSQLFQPKSWLVFEAIKYYLHDIGATDNFWVGKFEDLVENIYINETVTWSQGGKTVVGDCVVADAKQGYALRRTQCDNTAVYLCMEKKPKSDCPGGYHTLAGISSPSCIKMSGDISGPEVVGKRYSTIATANMVCMVEGTSLYTPQSEAERDAITALVRSKTIGVSGVVSLNSPLQVFLGLRYFNEPVGDWQDERYFSPWQAQIDLANGTALSGSAPVGEEESCRGVDGAGTDAKLTQGPCLLTKSDGSSSHAMCEARPCQPVHNKTCIFPFVVAGRTYDKCLTQLDGKAWCSLSLDPRGTHVAGNEADCLTGEKACFHSVCPVGFWPHGGTCTQESASHPDNVVPSVTEAEARCMKQGARLYQPRSIRSLQLLTRRTMAFFHQQFSGSASTLLPLHTQETALGITARVEGSEVSLWYRDGSQVPAGMLSFGGLVWAAGYPILDPDRTAINFVALGKIGNSMPSNFSYGGKPWLTYICEARPFTTVGGDDPGKPCHFPFRATTNSRWSHSCFYDKDVLGRDLAWCATEVDADGVVVPGKTGAVEDERSTAYAGPGQKS